MIKTGGEELEKEEFEKLYLMCETAVKRFAYYKLPSKADGDDVLQEALLAAYRNRDSIKNVESFKPWLLRIVANKCNDFYRTRAVKQELSLEGSTETRMIQSRFGLTVSETVQDTLTQLGGNAEKILRLFFLENLSQPEISKRLGIPVGTVKSRLYTAKQRFKSIYPFPPQSKGANDMSKLPNFMPEYKITKSEKTLFPVKWEELMGWFIVPKIGEKLSWVMYDFLSKKRSESYELEVIGKASVHGIDGVEITAHENRGGEHEGNSESRNLNRTFIVQLTDTHCRILAESHYDGDIKRFYTFLDADGFLPNWGFGEDNCGNEVNLSPKGIIKRHGSIITADISQTSSLLDVVGRYEVLIDGKKFDTICVMDIECYNNGVATEQFIDQNGRTVLWRRFNRNDWHFDHYRQLWNEKLPDNEQLTINGEIYVHWYDCITDYIL